MNTFEEVDRHVESTDMSAFKAEGNKVGAAASLSPEQLGSIYITVRPILMLVADMWFFPAKWQTVLKTFLAYLDAFTGVS